MGFGASPPKTPQQAARFETPGSPEYEAAVAKGLPMDDASRMQRGTDMGFRLNENWWHGSGNENITALKANKSETGEGVFLSDNPFVGEEYSNVRDIMSLPDLPAGQTNQQGLYQLVTRGNYKSVDAERQSWTRVNMRAEIDKARAEGFDGVDFLNIADAKYSRGMTGTTRVVFDPANIRSVNAAFDPDKATSSTLLAAAPFAAVGGAGLTSERELGSKMKRDKKD